MKYFWIPAALLSALLGASLLVARTAEADVAPCRAALAEARSAAAQEDWDAAARAVAAARETWDARHGWLHLVTAHDELEAADTLFAAAESFAAARDGAEFRAAAAQLDAQLRVVAELQKLTLRNVL